MDIDGAKEQGLSLRQSDSEEVEGKQKKQQHRPKRTDEWVRKKTNIRVH